MVPQVGLIGTFDGIGQIRNQFQGGVDGGRKMGGGGGGAVCKRCKMC